ncbi:MAG TPA: queuosine precursor transporter [Bacteroidia bacterium]|nr:queuosine precursor transporter [Bacteroidia bacterium]
MKLNKPTRLLLVLVAVFITCAITAELTSSKLFVVPLQFGGLDLGTYVSIIGILPWPVVFLTTDIINEFYGRKILRLVSVITSCMIALCFVIVYAGMQPHAFTGDPAGSIPGVASDEHFNRVFGQSLWIIIGSITAFMVGQLVDSFVFWFVKKRTGGKYIWLRTTGSTVISQLIDSFVVLYIGFVVPGIFTMSQFWSTGATNYLLKLMIAIALTPLIYLFHWIVEKYLGEEKAHLLEHTAEKTSE